MELIHPTSNATFLPTLPHFSSVKRRKAFSGSVQDSALLTLRFLPRFCMRRQPAMLSFEASRMNLGSKPNCTPRVKDADIKEEPVFDFNSGYVLRACTHFPARDRRPPGVCTRITSRIFR